MKRINISYDQLYELFVVQNLTQREISEEINVSIPTIAQQLKMHGITKPKKSIGKQFIKTIEYDILYELYVVENLTIDQICNKLQCDYSVIRRNLDDYNIVKDSSVYPRTNKKEFSYDTLYELYVVQNLTIKQMSEHLNTSEVTIGLEIKRNNVIKPPHLRPKPSNYITLEYDELNDSMTINNQNVYLTANDIGVSFPVVVRECEKHDIEIINSKSSIGELQVLQYIKSIINNDIRCSVRNIISPLELDIFIPDLNIAIEYNGLYWHSEQAGRGKQYHLNKTMLCNEKGIRLIHIFEDEWLLKPEIVKQKLAHILGASCNERVFARKCVVQEITATLVSPFLNTYHIQGAGPGSINLGLYHNTTLVAVMNFIDLKDGKYKLNRFATSCDVIGGFSKLLKNFIKKHKPEYIETFADIRWSSLNSNVYNKNGFEHVYNSEPNYFYTKDCVKRESRQKYMKHNLINILEHFDSSKTEHVNMDSNGYYRIYDCGNMKFVWRG